MRYLLCIYLSLVLWVPQTIHAQVLTASQFKQGPYGLPVDKGSTGLWFQLQKLKTTASAMHTTAHPDDEHAGLLTYLSRGEGVRTSLLTINRGEAGANATGSELFDALGLIRTEELLRSGQYYALDDQYFTSLTDYGYSKTLEEALRSWGREAVLEDMVRIIRMNRPLVVISRFHGSERDGHGHHQAAGGITPEAVKAAGDPDRFPNQLSEEGLRVWAPLKLYQGGVRKNEPHHIVFDQSVFDPILGDSYYNFGYYGLSLQRSQTSGRVRRSQIAPTLYYNRLLVDDKQIEEGFFDGLDTSLSGMYQLFSEEAPEAVEEKLEVLEHHIEEASKQFSIESPESAVPSLISALKTARTLVDMDLHEEVSFLIGIKIKQLQEAVNMALGIQLTALAVPEGTPVETSPWSPLPTLDGVVSGQSFDVRLDFSPGVDNPERSTYPVYIDSISMEAVQGLVFDEQALLDEVHVWRDHHEPGGYSKVITVRVDEQAEVGRPYFYRPSIKQNQYTTNTLPQRHLPHSSPAMTARVWYKVDGELVSVEREVRMRRANLPYGYKLEPLKILPKVAINASPATRMIPVQKGGAFQVEVEVINNDPSGSDGMLTLNMPEGWRSTPEHHAVQLSSFGERSTYTFEVEAAHLLAETYDIQVACTIDDVVYSEGYDKVERNELETQYLFKAAQIQVQGVHVDMASDLHVGYIMGVGDEVPSGIAQLGATVDLMDETDLARGDLSEYDVIVVGTRAYAVRSDLLNYNNRLIEYASEGGHLVVLYQTQEYEPEHMAPYPALLPRSAEEVSEQDSPVRVLVPEHAVFHTPNSITSNDFEEWVEQRGSKFFSTWDDRYTPLVEMNDTGQTPQRGAWLVAPVGDGYFTYFALAIHRQTPYAVPGPYRIFANVLSLGRER